MNYTQVKHTKCEKKHKKEKRHDIHVSRDDSVLHCADCDQQI